MRIPLYEEQTDRIVIGDETKGRRPKYMMGSVLRGQPPIDPEVRDGDAIRDHLEEPVPARNGSFDHRYTYMTGCVPSNEFERGMGVLFFGAQSPDEGKPELIFELGKNPRLYGNYDLTTYSVSGDDLLLIERVVLDESALPGELTLGMNLGEQYPLADYQGFRNDGTALDLSSYQLTDVVGLAGQPL